MATFLYEIKTTSGQLVAELQTHVASGVDALISDLDTEWNLTTELGAGNFNILYVELPDSASSEIIPPQIIVDQHDYEPTGWADAKYVYLDADAAHDITGFKALPHGSERTLINRGVESIKLKELDVLSLVDNQIWCPNDSDLTIQKKGTAGIRYDGVLSKWMVTHYVKN